MKIFRACCFLFLSLCFVYDVQAQYLSRDTINSQNRSILNLNSIIIPGVLIGYGYTSLFSGPIRNYDFTIRDQLSGNNKISIDDYLIYAPLAIDIGLSLGSQGGGHRFKDKALLYMMSTALNAALVYPVKSLTNRVRPDASDIRSFPSGHTSNAFVGAEYFWQENKKRSPWLAASGYLIASSTAYLRIYNNKHWFSDVLAGAGTGILSTKLVYWLYPSVKRVFQKNKSPLTVLPYGNIDFAGLIIHYKLN